MLKRDNERHLLKLNIHLYFLVVHEHYPLHANCTVLVIYIFCNNISMSVWSVSVAVKHQLLMGILWDNCAINQRFSLSYAQITSETRGATWRKWGLPKGLPHRFITIQACIFIPIWPNFFSIWAMLNHETTARLFFFLKFYGNLCKMKNCKTKTDKKVNHFPVLHFMRANIWYKFDRRSWTFGCKSVKLETNSLYQIRIQWNITLEVI